MENQNREFRGIWINKTIWLDKRLSPLDKIILMEIDSLCGEDGCFASNSYIADFCQCSESKVSSAINKLIELRYIRLKHFDGRTRILESLICLLENSSLPTRKEEADYEKLLHSKSLSNDESLSNDKNIIKKNNKESRNTDFATQRSGSTDKNSIKITDSAEEVNKIKNSTVCQLVEKEKNEINPPNPLYSSDEENLDQKDDFDDLFGEPVGTDRKSRLAQTNNSNGTLAKELFDYWNSKNLRVHRAFQSHYVERFSKLMQKYTMEQIKHIIDNYEKIVHDKVYYWSYVWDLQDFIEEEKFLRFADDGQEWLNYKQGTKSQQAFRRTAFHNEEYNQALKEGKDIGALDDMHAEEVRKLRSSPNVIKL